MRIYPDTNVLVSAMATRGLCADLVQVILAEHELLIGETVLSELGRVLERKLRLSTQTIREWDGFFRREGELVRAGAVPAIRVRDPADRVVLAEAVAGGADALVTGDRDLLSIAARAPVRIQSPREFWDFLRSQE